MALMAVIKYYSVSRVSVTPVFLFLNTFKLDLEERHLACGFKCTPRN